MKARTDRFADTLTASHQLATRVEVLHDGAAVQALDVVTDGTVTLDSGARRRGRLTGLTLADPDRSLAPDGILAELLAYPGAEIQPWRGVAYPDTAPELVPLGVFRIDEVDVDDTPAGQTITITGPDRTAAAEDDRLEDTTTVAAGTNLADLIRAILAPVVPSARFWLPATTAVTTEPAVWEAGTTRWAWAEAVADALGWLLWFDGIGDVRGGPTPEPFTELAGASLVAAGAGSTVIRRIGSVARADLYNAVIATGEPVGTAAPVRGVAYDLDPTSPTRWGGPFGRRPRFYSSPLITTQAQATATAASILERTRKLSRRWRLTTVPHPHLEPGDTLAVTGRDGSTVAHLIDAITVPLAADGRQSITTRSAT